MARAKRTDRTEARRRYRAQFVEENGGADDGDELDDTTSTSAGAPARRVDRSARAASASAEPRPARPGFMSSARAAYHAPNYREDIALLPRLLVHWSVLLSAALAVVGTGIIIGVSPSLNATTAAGSTADGGTATLGAIANLLVQMFVGPPPFGAALLIGFMLPRATYLVGLVFGVLAALCITVIILVLPAVNTGLTPAALLYVWVFGIVGSAFFAAGIAWYKRFLELLNPNRGQRRPAAKPVQGRGNVRRNRLSS